MRKNKNTKIVNAIEKRLNIMEETYGKRYCPCKPNEMTENNICPCKEAREESKCCCGLYEFD